MKGGFYGRYLSSGHLIYLRGSTIFAVQFDADRLEADKYQQVFSTDNPVSTSHFNFSVLEPTGVVAIIAPEKHGLLGLVSNVAPAVAGGNTCIVLASQSLPLSAISFAEVLQASDFPAGVINVLTGHKAELLETFASHMDVNAIVYGDSDAGASRRIQELAADNIQAGHPARRPRLEFRGGPEPLLHPRHPGNQDHLASGRELTYFF